MHPENYPSAIAGDLARAPIPYSPTRAAVITSHFTTPRPSRSTSSWTISRSHATWQASSTSPEACRATSRSTLAACCANKTPTRCPRRRP
jgi:hypothetical protein